MYESCSPVLEDNNDDDRNNCSGEFVHNVLILPGNLGLSIFDLFDRVLSFNLYKWFSGRAQREILS